jgi:hypothetical protein
MSGLRLWPKGTSLSVSGRESDSYVPLAAGTPGTARAAAAFEVVR